MGTQHRLEPWPARRIGARQPSAASRPAANRPHGRAGDGHRDSARIGPHHRTGSQSSGRSVDRCRVGVVPDHSCANAYRRLASLALRARRGRPLLGDSLMPERAVQIVNKNGLHARPAAEIVKLAAKFQSEITIVKDDLDVNGKSIMGVMMLAAEHGSTILLRAEGPDADAAIEALATLVGNKFGER